MYLKILLCEIRYNTMSMASRAPKKHDWWKYFREWSFQTAFRVVTCFLKLSQKVCSCLHGVVASVNAGDAVGYQFGSREQCCSFLLMVLDYFLLCVSISMMHCSNCRIYLVVCIKTTAQWSLSIRCLVLPLTVTFFGCFLCYYPKWVQNIYKRWIG